MTFKRKPEGTALTHHAEYRAADATVWKYRGTLLSRGMDMDDVAGDIIVHLLTKKHLYDPAKAKFSTWCRYVAERLVWRMAERADYRAKMMQGWRPAAAKVYRDDPQDEAEMLRFLFACTPLTARERRFITSYYSGKTLRKVAAEERRTPERIRQVLCKGVRKMQLQAQRMAVHRGMSVADYWGTV